MIDRKLMLAPVAGPSVWTADALRDAGLWRYRLTAEESRALEACARTLAASGRPMSDLSRGEANLGALEPRIADWMETLERGIGFVNVSGLPVDTLNEEEIAYAHWAIGLHMGTGVSQNAAGDILGHVRDVGANPADRGKRLYKTRVELGFHSDGADVIALLCLRPAKFGGENRLASCGAIYNEFVRRRPDLAPLLYENFHWDRNNEQAEGEPPFFALPICSRSEDTFRMFYIGWYIRNAQRHADVPRMSAEQVQALDLIDEIAHDPAFHVSFRLEAGEVNYLKNNAALHMRTAYEDFDDPTRKRHLLRMWLTAHGDWNDGDDFVRQGIPKKQGAETDAGAIARDQQ